MANITSARREGASKRGLASIMPAFIRASLTMRRPVTMVFAQHFETITDAIAAERQVKGWSRAKKEAMINAEWNRLLNWRSGEVHIRGKGRHKQAYKADVRSWTPTQRNVP